RLTIEDPSTRGVRSYCAAKNPGTVTAEVASSSLVVPRPGNKGRKTREDLHPGRIHRLPAVFTHFCFCHGNALVFGYASGLVEPHCKRPRNSSWETTREGNAYSCGPGIRVLGCWQELRGHHC